MTNVFKYWYHNHTNVLRWGIALFEPHTLKCGVRQEGLISPKLFNLYINALIGEISSKHARCFVDGVCLNNISYTDDMVLLALSISAMRKLIGICELYAASPWPSV